MSGWDEIQKNIKEFFIDIHSIAQQFVGERDWQWLTTEENSTYSTYQRFVNEMMSGAQFYTNESNLEDRLILGTCTALYCLPYTSARILFYEPLANILEYAFWRIADK